MSNPLTRGAVWGLALATTCFLSGCRPGRHAGSGRPRVVAYFPVSSVGRIRPGQAARLRLDGFPWTRYGLPEAAVVDVGTEPADGLVRVEMALTAGSAPAIPREHGLTGTAEVTVERLSPAQLVLRAAGRLLTTKPTPSAATTPEKVAAP